MSRKKSTRDIFKALAAQGREEKKISEVYKYLTPEELAEMEALTARMDELKDKNADRAHAAMVEEAKRKAEYRRSFYGSPRCEEIRNYIRSHSDGISQEDVHYFPEKYPFTPEEFDDFCSIIFERFEDQAESDDPYVQVVRDGGVRLTLVIGQGSSFFAVKDDDDGVTPAPELNRD
ncbi:MAG: hypothetical protein LRY54_04215 [Alphaproteobacteria bacterium]|nr:hypothetical protein [Alphaproteobacteria bacterium]